MYKFIIKAEEDGCEGFDYEAGQETFTVYHYVTATDKSTGKRFVHFKDFKTAGEAERLATKIESVRDFTPINSPYWKEVVPFRGY